MRVVTIGATHEAFVHAMFEGHRELRSNARVTGIAEVDLFGSEQELRYWRLVNGVTVGADDVVSSM